MANKDYTFNDLAKDLDNMVENLYETIDESLRSFVLQVGMQLIARTPKDTGYASTGWYAEIDDESFAVPALMSNWITREQNSLLDKLEMEDSPEFSSTRNEIKEGIRTREVAMAESQILQVVNNFNIKNNMFITITNNIDYIGLLAYHNHAYKAKPLAPAGRIVEDNLAENDYMIWFEKSDKILKGM